MSDCFAAVVSARRFVHCFDVVSWMMERQSACNERVLSSYCRRFFSGIHTNKVKYTLNLYSALLS